MIWCLKELRFKGTRHCFQHSSNSRHAVPTGGLVKPRSNVCLGCYEVRFTAAYYSGIPYERHETSNFNQSTIDWQLKINTGVPKRTASSSNPFHGQGQLQHSRPQRSQLQVTGISAGEFFVVPKTKGHLGHPADHKHRWNLLVELPPRVSYVIMFFQALSKWSAKLGDPTRFAWYMLSVAWSATWIFSTMISIILQVFFYITTQSTNCTDSSNSSRLFSFSPNDLCLPFSSFIQAQFMCIQN